MTPARTLALIWAGMRRPSARDEDPYLSVLIGIGHAVLGAALAGCVADALGLAVAAARALVPAAYWLVKERADLRRGGLLADSLGDAGMVTLGTLYSLSGAAAWWPLAVLAGPVALTVLIRLAR